MNNWCGRSRAFTVAEIVIVVIIVIILSASILVVVGPPLRAKSQEARIKSDLRQCAGIIALYQSDHDEHYPLSRLSMNAYGYPSGPSELSYSRGYYLPADYNLQYDYWHRLVEEKHTLKHRWLPEDHTVVKEAFFVRKMGRYRPLMYQGPTRGWVRSNVDQVRLQGLAVSVDGHCKWVDLLEEWEDEYSWYLGSVVLESLQP